jgi:hypothetical protein
MTTGQDIYDETTEMKPAAGDVVIAVGPTYESLIKPGARGVIDGSMQHLTESDRRFVCFGASAFREGDYVACSGGPVPSVHVDQLYYVGQTKRTFWCWIDRPRAGGGREYEMTVNLWEWIRTEETP